jgi:hypothetical protein
MPKTVVGTGADWWVRPTNRYPNCTCPPARYNPKAPKPTSPDCPEHGGMVHQIS